MVTITNIVDKADLFNKFFVSPVSFRLLTWWFLTVAIHSTWNSVILEVWAVFWDISKTFDKVWHPGLLFKLKSHGIGEKLFKLSESYLHNLKHRVALDGHCWWKYIFCYLQGSVGPLLFLRCINDFSVGHPPLYVTFSVHLSVHPLCTISQEPCIMWS